MHVDTGVDTSLCQVPSVNAIECAPSQFQSSVSRQDVRLVQLDQNKPSLERLVTVSSFGE